MFYSVRLSTVGRRVFPVAGARMERFTVGRYLLTVAVHI